MSKPISEQIRGAVVSHDLFNAFSHIDTIYINYSTKLGELGLTYHQIVIYNDKDSFYADKYVLSNRIPSIGTDTFALKQMYLTNRSRKFLRAKTELTTEDKEYVNKLASYLINNRVKVNSQEAALQESIYIYSTGGISVLYIDKYSDKHIYVDLEEKLNVNKNNHSMH